MEIAGLVVGFAGLASVFETSCSIWSTIAKAADYGQSVANALSKLEMEFFKFQAWWVVLDKLAADPRTKSRSAENALLLPSKDLIRKLQSDCGHPLTNAAKSILRILEQLQEILKKNGALELTARASHEYQQEAALASQSSDHDLAMMSRKAASRDRILSTRLQKSTPFFRRVIHAARPWKEPDKARIAELLQDFGYWNRNLYETLPSNIRESVLVYGMAGYLLDSTDELPGLLSVKDVDAQGRVVVECAKLVELRKRMRLSPGHAIGPGLQSSLEHMKKNEWFAGRLPEKLKADELFSQLTCRPSEDCKPAQSIDCSQFQN